MTFYSQPAQLSNEEKKQIGSSDTTGELVKYLKKISRLENEKDSLLLQVSVLTDQVEVQGEKMRELEFLRDELQIKVADLEETVKKVVNSFSSGIDVLLTFVVGYVTGCVIKAG